MSGTQHEAIHVVLGKCLPDEKWLEPLLTGLASCQEKGSLAMWPGLEVTKVCPGVPPDSRELDSSLEWANPASDRAPC